MPSRFDVSAYPVSWLTLVVLPDSLFEMSPLCCTWIVQNTIFIWYYPEMPSVLVFPFLGVESETAFFALPSKERIVLAAAYFSDVIKVRESGGNNRGTWVERFLQAVSLGPGYAWCAAAVSFVLLVANVKAGPPRGRAAVRNWEDWARENNKLYHMKFAARGDLVGYTKGKQRLGHIGICTGDGISPSIRLTVEGNTNADGARDGDGFYRKKRTVNDLWWCIKL